MATIEWGMESDSYSLNDLADATGIEARTVRSYIERGLLPGAHSRGRGAAYGGEHLSLLKVIQMLRRARPDITLTDLRIQLQRLTPEQIHALAGGAITAAVAADAPILDEEHADPDGDDDIDTDPPQRSPAEGVLALPAPPEQLTGPERLVQALRKLSGYTAPVPASRAECWHRITVTEDIELSVRAGFDSQQISAFRELADILRLLLTRPDALRSQDDD